MKKHIAWIMAALITTAGLVRAQSPKDDAWRNDMAAFAKSVAAIAAQSEIPNQFQLTESIRSRIAPTREGRPLWVILKTSSGKELHGELLKAFDGKVSWSGKVKAAKADQETKTSSITIVFPAADGMPASCALQDAIVSVPFDKLPADKLPAVGSVFSFKASFQTAKPDDLLDRV